MSAQEQMKKMLDELMGTKRDGESKEDGTKFTDSGVCKSFLMGLCPYELFHNTKLDLGPCHKYHSLALKADFEQAAKTRDYGYDADQLEHLTSFVRDCDRKVEVNKKRLEDNNNDENDTSNEATTVHDLNEKIGKMLAQSEELGADGKVDESFALMKEVEELKAEKRKAEELYRSTLPVTATQQQKLRVCDICGAYLSLYDNDRRLADHFGGKLHMGFIKIRDRLAELQKSVAAKREAREKEREARRKERAAELEKERSSEKDRRRRSRSRSKEGSRRRDRSRERYGERSRDRDSRRRDQGRYRDRRDYDRDRRGGDRDRRDYDRDRRDGRDRRDDDRDRYRSRDRSRSRERSKNRNRSRERYESRERNRNGDRDRRRSREASSDRKRSNSKDRQDDAPSSKMVTDDKRDEVQVDGEADKAAENSNASSVINDEQLTNDNEQYDKSSTEN